MKTKISKGKSALTLLLVTALLLFTAACTKGDGGADWSYATYSSDATIGNGSSKLTVEITAGDESITLTIMTDKGTLSEALFEHELVNHPSFFDTLNGIKADYDKDGAWWKVCDAEGNAASVGIDDLEVTDGSVYKIVYTVGY